MGRAHALRPAGEGAAVVRIATFNVHSLFERAAALNEQDWAVGRPALEAQARVNEILGNLVYTPDDKAEIVRLLTDLGLARSDDGGRYAILRQNVGRLVKRSKGTLTVVAEGRADWIGWVELKTEPVNEVATRNTAQVLRDVGAQIQAVVEADSRTALRDFSSIMLPAVGAEPFAHVMLIDGNDDRKIDVGLLTRPGFDIVGIVSHVDDADDQGLIFSRDCPEYTVATPAGRSVVLLVNHLKSKGFGSQQSSNARRARQAARVAAIYEGLVAAGRADVIVLGDFNDTPASAPLAALLAGTDLRDVTTHPTFVSDGHPGTFGNGNAADKIDYLLLSPSLYDRVTGGAIFRKGVWGGVHGDRWPIYPTMTRPVEAASDHAALWADLDL